MKNLIVDSIAGNHLRRKISLKKGILSALHIPTPQAANLGTGRLWLEWKANCKFWNCAAPPTIVEEAARFIKRFVFFNEESHYFLLGTWAVATHLYQLFDYFGYVFAYSAEPQCGKSRLLEILDMIVFNSSGLLVSPTESVLFRSAINTTQIFDEVDAWTNKDALRGVLNSGFHRSGTVKRSAQQSDGSYQVESFQVYAPRALAGIGDRILSAPTRDRTFMLKMLPQTIGERRERFRVRKIAPEGSRLKCAIAEWARANEGQVQSFYDGAFPYIECFRDRTIDISEPLAAIVETAYRNHPAHDEASGRLFHAISNARPNEGAVTNDALILAELERLACKSDPLIGNATELAEQCAGLKVNALSVSAVLRKHGFKSHSNRRGGLDPKQRYKLTHAELQDLCTRFVRQQGGNQAA